MDLLSPEEVAHLVQETNRLRRRAAQAEDSVQRMLLLNELSRRMNLATTEAEVFQIAAELAPQIFKVDRASIALLTETGNEVEIRALKGVVGDVPKGVTLRLDETDFAAVVCEQRLVIQQDNRADASLSEIRARMNAPLITGGHVIGSFNVGSHQAYAFTAEDANLMMQVSALLASTIESRRLFAKIQIALAESHEKNLELLDTLSQLHEAQAQLIQFETMAALGRLVAGVAHEINTPLGISVTAASVLEEQINELRTLYTAGQLKRQDLETYLDLAGQSSQLLSKNLTRAAELVQSFKQVAVDQSIEERRHFQIKAYLEEILLSIGSELRRTQHQVEIVGDEQICIDSYPGAFGQIITNLLMNSLIHAYQPGQKGRLRFEIYRQKEQIHITYCDDGCGIPPELLPRVFEPFFTTKRGQGGTGLGLHIVYNLVTQKLGGHVACESHFGAGTKFMITLPATYTLGAKTMNAAIESSRQIDINSIAEPTADVN